jgi:Ribosomal protein S21
MGIRIVLREGESISHAIKRLNELILENNRRPVYAPYSHKRTVMYYEKPNVLKRRWRRIAWLNRKGNMVRCRWYMAHRSYRGY